MTKIFVISSLLTLLSTTLVQAATPIDSAEDQRCLRKIAKAVCLADTEELGSPRPRCQPEGQKYVSHFTELYRDYPRYLRRMLCSLTVIGIETDNSGGSAAATILEDDRGRIIGGYMGVKQVVLDQGKKLDAHTTWGEQRHFGGDSRLKNVSTGTPGLPFVRTSQEGLQGWLYYVVAHELGHVFDFTNNLNHEFGEAHNALGDQFWNDISWINFQRIRPDFDFIYRAQLCTVDCKKQKAPVAANEQDAFYSAIAKTNFLTTYAMSNASEDFAETFAMYVLWSERRATYEIVTNTGQVFPVIERLDKDPLMAAKRDYIERFLRSRIRYPGMEFN